MDFSFNIEFAKRYGVDEAIMVKSFQFWIRLNKANKINYYDKRYWTYNTNKSLTEYYPFWSEKQVRRIIESLVDKEILIKGNYNKIAYDRTIWYAFINEDLYLSDNFHLEEIEDYQKVNTILPNGQMEKTKRSNRFTEKGEPIPVANHVLNTNTNQIIEEKEIFPPKTKIKNPFSRQAYHDSLNTDSDPKENFAKKEKVKDREPSETYLCFSAFASTYERLAGVTYPSDKNNYIMTAKDGANCKKLITWLKKVSASEQATDEMVTMFTTAAWQISDKWLKANFTISNIYSQANNIYTKFMYSNPAAQEKRRQDEIERLVNEYQP
jgi:hypothetical protein